MIIQLLDSDWPANILAGLNCQAQGNGLISPDGVCAISEGPAGNENNLGHAQQKRRHHTGLTKQASNHIAGRENLENPLCEAQM